MEIEKLKMSRVLLRAMSDIDRNPEFREAFVVRESLGELSGTVVIQRGPRDFAGGVRAAGDTPDLTECQRVLLGWFRGQPPGTQRTAEQMYDELILVHQRYSRSAINAALTALRKLRFLENPGNRRGYRLPPAG